MISSVGATRLIGHYSSCLVGVEVHGIRTAKVSYHTHTTPVSVIPHRSTGLEVAALLAEGPLQGGALIRWHNGESFI